MFPTSSHRETHIELIVEKMANLPLRRCREEMSRIKPMRWSFFSRQGARTQETRHWHFCISQISNLSTRHGGVVYEVVSYRIVYFSWTKSNLRLSDRNDLQILMANGNIPVWLIQCLESKSVCLPFSWWHLDLSGWHGVFAVWPLVCKTYGDAWITVSFAAILYLSPNRIDSAISTYICYMREYELDGSMQRIASHRIATYRTEDERRNLSPCFAQCNFSHGNFAYI